VCVKKRADKALVMAANPQVLIAPKLVAGASEDPAVEHLVCREAESISQAWEAAEAAARTKTDRGSRGSAASRS
jgi:hypothetical protein